MLCLFEGAKPDAHGRSGQNIPYYPNAASRGFVSGAARGFEGRKETRRGMKRERHDHHKSSVQGTGRCAIYPYIKSAPASRREVHTLEQVPPLAWQHCETCSMFDEAAEKQQHPQPPIATIVRQVTSNIVAFCMSWNRESHIPTSPCRAVRKAVHKIRLTPLPPDSAMPLRAAPRRTPHSWQ